MGDDSRPWRGTHSTCNHQPLPVDRHGSSHYHLNSTPSLPFPFISSDTLVSQTFVHALLYVATYTENVEQLREEILEATIAEGFTRDAVNKMPKLDSFVGETQRLSGISSGTSDSLTPVSILPMTDLSQCH
jgi:Cytochrome P450